MAEQTVQAALEAAGGALARAVREGNVRAEQFARSQLTAWRLAVAYNNAVEAGLDIDPELARDWRVLIIRLAGGEEPIPTEAVRRGSEALVRLLTALTTIDEEGGTCDRCGAQTDGGVSGIVDLVTGGLQLDRLCDECRTARAAR